MWKRVFLIFALLASFVIITSYLINSKFKKPSVDIKTPSTKTSIEEGKSAKITLTNYKEQGPIIIPDTYPTGWASVGGKQHNSTQITILAELYIPEEDDYSVSSGFDSVCTITTIDGIEGEACESPFHLTKGVHDIEIKYIQDRCLDRKYIIETYGEEAKPLSIHFSIRKKSANQSIKNYTTYDNPIEIRTNSKPYKKTDLYLHCLP